MKRLATRFGVVPMVFVMGLLLGSVMTGTAWAVQIHMQNALHDLQNAQAELNAAASDKGGHRVQAMNLVNQAIQQVKWGIQYAQ